MRNTHFIPEPKNAQYALRITHEETTIPRMSVGEKIRELRAAREMTLAEVEARAGLSDGNLSRIERGKQWVSEDVLRSIASALGVTVASLFDDGMQPSTDRLPAHPAVNQITEMLEQAADEVRLLTVYRLASVTDKAEIDAAVSDVISRLDIVSILNKRKG